MSARNSLSPAVQPTKKKLENSGSGTETVLVHEKTVACDGIGGALGHPRIYLNMGANTQVGCPYCSRVFVLAPADQQHVVGQHRDAGGEGTPAA